MRSAARAAVIPVVPPAPSWPDCQPSKQVEHLVARSHWAVGGIVQPASHLAAERPSVVVVFSLLSGLPTLQQPVNLMRLGVPPLAHPVLETR